LSNEGQLCGTIFFPFFFLVLETEDGFLVSSSSSYFLNEVTEDGFCLPVFNLFGRSLGVQQLGSLTSYRTAVRLRIWS
jgi:hypothetical protein